jgi:hypothetical protein
LIILATAFFIAIRYKKDYQLHARGMIVTGLACIEPAFIRFAFRVISDPFVAYLTTIFTLYAVFLVFIYCERKQAKARWVFPLVIGLYVIAHGLVLFDMLYLPFWRDCVMWFAHLPLTTILI